MISSSNTSIRRRSGSESIVSTSTLVFEAVLTPGARTSRTFDLAKGLAGAKNLADIVALSGQARAS